MDFALGGRHIRAVRFEPLTPANVVEVLSVSCEHALFDFKMKYELQNPATAFEIAKDICAFANYLGGTIAIGVVEGSAAFKGRPARFEPLTAPAGDIVKVVDRVAKQLCRPRPSVDALEIPLTQDQVAKILGRPEPAASIVAVNVMPMREAPIACAACTETCKACETAGLVCSCNGKEVPFAFRFPVRAIESTVFLGPHELAKMMNVDERRALLDLNAIPKDERISVWFDTGDGKRGVSRPCRIISLDTSAMLVKLETLYSESNAAAEIPLRFVRACWKAATGWNVLIDGIAFEMDGRGKRHGYVPPGGFIT